MDNVYSYGRPDGRPLVETRPHRAHTVKGRLRAGMAAELLAEHRAGRVEVVIAKVSDYFGPGARRAVQPRRPGVRPCSAWEALDRPG
jgi:hypothetical protein